MNIFLGRLYKLSTYVLVAVVSSALTYLGISDYTKSSVDAGDSRLFGLLVNKAEAGYGHDHGGGFGGGGQKTYGGDGGGGDGH